MKMEKNLIELIGVFMTKYFFLLLLIFFWITLMNAQIVNLNPDPNGEPWITGGVPERTPEIQAILEAIPDLILTEESENQELRDVVDNSTEIYMRPIFLQ